MQQKIDVFAPDLSPSRDAILSLHPCTPSLYQRDSLSNTTARFGVLGNRPVGGPLVGFGEIRLGVTGTVVVAAPSSTVMAPFAVRFSGAVWCGAVEWRGDVQ